MRAPRRQPMYLKVLREDVAEMADSIHGELRKPSGTSAKTSEIASKLRAAKQARSVRKQCKMGRKSAPHPQDILGCRRLTS